MRDFARDLRFGVRLLAKSPVFTITAVLLLAIGISANTLIFSFLDALLLRPLPAPHPENLVRIVERHPNDFITWDLPYDFCDAARNNPDFTEVICQVEAELLLSDRQSGTRVIAHLVSPNFFSSLGARAYLGRLLNVEDEQTRSRNAVLSYSFWQRQFHGDPSVIGRAIALNRQPFTIVGVLQDGFSGVTVDTNPDVRIPASLDRALLKPLSWAKDPSVRPASGQIVGRLRNGVSLAQADARADSLLHTSFQEITNRIFPQPANSKRPKDALASHLRLESAANGISLLRPQFSRGLEVLMGGVALLLLLACANVAGLLLARSAGRTQEMSVRLALGAKPGRLVRQLLTEGAILALAGGLSAILLAAVSLPFLAHNLPALRDRAAVLHPISIHTGIDLRVAAFALGTTILTVLVFALSPALRAARTPTAGTLRAGRTATGHLSAGNFVVAGQIAICTLILIGSALLVATLEKMRAMNPGFDRDRVVTVTVNPELGSYRPEQVRALSKAVLDKVSAMPGVAAASIAGRGLMRGTGLKGSFGVAGARITPADFLNSSMNSVTPGYFQTMGMRLMAGRYFTWFDRKSSPEQVIVNQAFAHHFFPGANPIGKRFGLPGPGGVASGKNEIVGVVTDAKYRSLREPVPPTVYSAVVDGFDSDFILHVRTPEPPEALIQPIQASLRTIDPDLPVVEIRPLREEVEASLWQERLLASLSLAFAMIATILAGIGLYGAMDYAVKARTREIGVRMALGARPAQIVGLYSREALLLTAAGLAAGLCGYAAVAVWIRRVLYGFSPWEPIAVIPVILLVAILSAIAIAPALYRAGRIDPASAMRAE